MAGDRVQGPRSPRKAAPMRRFSSLSRPLTRVTPFLAARASSTIAQRATQDTLDRFNKKEIDYDHRRTVM